LKSETPDSGMEELLRLSKQIARVDQERTKEEQARTEHRQKATDVQQRLIELKASVALEQLKLIATPEIIQEVSSLKNKPNTQGLRKLILDLTSELEKWVDNRRGSQLDMDTIKSSVKTLAILVELLFSIE
jgi:hypothetical protein